MAASHTHTGGRLWPISPPPLPCYPPSPPWLPRASGAPCSPSSPASRPPTPLSSRATRTRHSRLAWRRWAVLRLCTAASRLRTLSAAWFPRLSKLQVQNAASLQVHLGLKADSDFGVQTCQALLLKIAPHAKLADQLSSPMIADFAKYEINTRLRIMHFLSRAHVETMGFALLKELWGPTEAQENYQGRYGNNMPGDGRKYCGRGIFQYTFKDNYEHLESVFNVDFVNKPELLEQPEWAVMSSCYYWNSKKLNYYADRDDGLSIGRSINCGSPNVDRTPNGWDQQRKVANSIRSIWPE